MAEIKAFKALRFTKESGDISKNVCPPYDIISEAERLAYIRESKNNIIRLELPVGENAYKDAAQTLKEFKKDGVLAVDGEDTIYIYEEEFEVFGKVKKFKGIFVRVRLEEFSKGVVLPHEETLSKAKEDRFNLMSATFCNFSPIYSMYTDEERKITSKIDECSSGAPEIEFVDGAGVTQRLWTVTDKSAIDYIEKAFEAKQLFIADGHHRYETGINFRNKLIAEGKITSSDDAGNFIMMFLVDMENDGLVVFPTHRVLRDLKNFNPSDALLKMEQFFEICEISKEETEKKLSENKDKKSYVFVLEDKYYLLTLKEDAAKPEIDKLLPEKSEAYRDLDVSILHTLVLERIFGIDKENMAKQINLAYTRDMNEAIDGVASGKFQCAFLLCATKVSQIKDVALANDKMPQKSTYFYPKIITGLVMNEIEPIK